jgi:ligand-binding sensor domain-containing protein/AraC-like DNA-binding protein
LNSIKKKHLKKFFYLFLLQTLVPVYHLFAFYTEKHPEDYLINIWTVEDGLPQNTIQTLLQTHDGFIWIGTPSGLVRFDGLDFKVFTRWDLPVLKNDNITCLYEDQNNVLWVGTEGGGLCALMGGQWINYSTTSGLSSDRVRAIISDQHGDLWVGTDYGLNQINKDGIKIYTEKDGLYDNIITSLAVDSWNNLWIGTFRGGLAKYSREIVSIYGYQEGLKNLSVRTLLTAGKGFLWIGTSEGMYFLKREEDIVQPVRGTAYTPINTILENSPDELWIGTMVSGVKQMNPNDFTRKAVTNLLPDDFIHCSIKDNAGNIWLGTDTGGLVQLKVRRISNLTEEQGLPHNVISAVFQDRSESIWIGTKNKGLINIRGDGVHHILNMRNGLSSDRVRVIYEDTKGFLWIGTDDSGINILNKNNVYSKLTIEDGLSSNRIKSILEDHRGTMWIGTEDGLNSYVNGRFSVYNKIADPNNHVINVLLEAQSKVLYVGTDKGVYQLIDNSLQPLDQNLHADYEVISLYQDQDNAIWIGTNGNGLFRWLNGQLEAITKDGGLHDNFILSIYEDEHKNFWMSSHSGIFWVKRREISNFFEKKITQIQSIWYNESEGMASRQCVGDGQPSVLKTTTGRLLYPTVKGVSILEPKFLIDYCTVPQIQMEYIFCGEDTIKIDDETIPQIGGEMISFAFTATEFSAPGKIRFKYMLEGHDEKFGNINPGDERRATYHNLPFGEHTFRLLAANNEGRWSEEATLFTFRVNPPFYLRPTFIFIFIGISLLFSTALVYINHNRKKQKRLDKYKTSRLDRTKMEEIVSELDDLMTREKLFLDPDLTLGDLAKRLKIHYNYISRIINEHFGLSYNDFINKYRVEEVKTRFSDPDYMNKTVLEIMYETGFYSKSVFNTAFKKFTGVTPSEYRKNIN